MSKSVRWRGVPTWIHPSEPWWVETYAYKHEEIPWDRYPAAIAPPCGGAVQISYECEDGTAHDVRAGVGCNHEFTHRTHQTYPSTRLMYQCDCPCHW